MKKIVLTIGLAAISAIGFGQEVTTETLENKTAPKGECFSYGSPQGIINVGDTLILGTPSGANMTTFTYLLAGPNLGALTSQKIPLASSWGGRKVRVKKMVVRKSFGQMFVLISLSEAEKFGAGSMVITHTYYVDKAMELGEIRVKGFMTRETAIAKLKEYKDLLDLEMMTQGEFNEKKKELIKYIN